MLKVGLTGGIGSGKSLVAKVFETLGVPVFYADYEAKKIMISHQKVKSEIIELFGNKAFTGELLNREYIAEKVFSDPEVLRKLNSIVHPVVHQQFINWTKNHQERPYVIEEAAILFESGGNTYFDYIILVAAPEKIRIERVMKRDKVSEERVRERMNNQIPNEKKISMADFVINNDNDSMILPQVLDIHEKLISLHRKK